MESASNYTEAVATRVQAIFADSPACHDWDHTRRVRANARHLAAAEGADALVVDLAALLHDVARPEELRREGRVCHAVQGAQMTPELLREAGIADEDFIRHVADCVRTHRYRRRGGGIPATLEARIVFDADKLDAIGAIGIGRAFHFAGRIGSRLHNREAEARAAASYSSEDSAYREYLVKLQHLHEKMLTAEGRRIATGRHHFMVEFFARLNREVEGHDYP